jgi:hypothetical protein
MTAEAAVELSYSFARRCSSFGIVKVEVVPGRFCTVAFPSGQLFVVLMLASCHAVFCQSTRAFGN